MTVQRILNSKGTAVPTILPDATIDNVIVRLEAEDSGALVISSDGKVIEGIISERDVVRGLRKFGTDAMAMKVTELMTEKVFTCNANDRVAGVMAMMDEKKIRHMPVVHNGSLSGMVSIRDIIKLRLDEVQAEADTMREYISQAWSLALPSVATDNLGGVKQDSDLPRVLVGPLLRHVQAEQILARLLDSLYTRVPSRNREVELEKARARSAARFNN